MPTETSGASRVAAGILASRIAGFLRERAMAHYFGVGPHADVFRTALRGPNLLQNLLGEGTLSASFIPIYSRLLAEGKREDAGRFAGAMFGLLLAAAGGLALLGVLFAQPIVTVLTPGFLADAKNGAAIDRFPLAVAAVRWIFPMTGILVLSAWALGVLNSHRRFFLAYFAPVLWNVAIIGALWWAGHHGGPGAAAAVPLDRLLQAACAGALLGGFLQFAIQMPLVLRLMRGFRVSWSLAVGGVRPALRALWPAMAGRGAVQAAAYLDQFLASFLVPGAVGALGYAFTLYALPAALFGTSVAVAELPELSSAKLGPEHSELVERRLSLSLQSVGFMNIAASFAYAGFGLLVVGALYRTGSFNAADGWLTYLVLAGFTVGLAPGGCSRLLQNAFYSFGDTRTPARIAVLRVGLSALLGVPAMLLLDRVALADWVGQPSTLRLGAAGLSLATGLAAWVELFQLDRRLRQRLPGFHLPLAGFGRMILAAAGAGAPAALAWWLVRALHPVVAAAAVLGVFGGSYLGLASVFGVQAAKGWLERLRTLGRRGRRIPL
ncbi:MAG: murein biosynthesis integral membrane protein MurJ [Acidobacteriota bacterium]